MEGADVTEDAQPVVWSKTRRDPARRAPSVERIVETALAIADAEGLEAVSMRRVATELASGTASMYRYVANRDELLDLMIDAAQGDIALPPLTGDGRADLAALARQRRETLLRHRWLGAELTGRPALGPNALRRFDAGIAAALQLTADIGLAAQLVDTVSAYVHGTVTQEVAELRAQQRTGLSEDQWRASVGPYLRDALATGAYPALARRLHEAEDPTDAERFEFGLACVLEGVSRAARSPR
ncbi:TetR family transcriptional regulator [Nocardia sp. ET3-3]|uniref:TetR family transcriptional regulator n=1 Tax=Nocardia terrae TaxID=2675851 RepID=A0A7K1UW47_9NOCA|nr:TetR/AcrR family transcriptional regulator C-terminal domain-containing protein [Nocardia terrae]MVU78616.1 TetR family transcriptional regulator [Nocardia terrae]